MPAFYNPVDGNARQLGKKKDNNMMLIHSQAQQYFYYYISKTDIFYD